MILKEMKIMGNFWDLLIYFDKLHFVLQMQNIYIYITTTIQINKNIYK